MTDQLLADRKADSNRSNFAGRWLLEARSQHCVGKVYSAFFHGHIAYVVSAGQRYYDSHKHPLKESDNNWETIAIEYSMKQKASNIDSFLTGAEGLVLRRSLLLRVIPDSQNERILGSMGNSEVLVAANWLAKIWSPLHTSNLNDREQKEQTRVLALIFRIVRNRLFHGSKTYDESGSDADLLEKLNPMLFGVVDILLEH